MTTHQLFVENLRCSGCVNSIQTALMKMKGVTAVEVTLAEDKVCVSGVNVEKEELVEKLAALGYPQKGSNSFMNKAKSMVSCAVGRVSTNNNQ